MHDNIGGDVKSWTDDLQVCHCTGAGFATNQCYKDDGTRQEIHKFGDRSFYCQFDVNTSLYAIFSGQNGCKVADMTLQRIAAEILLGQLTDTSSVEDVKEVLRLAFVSVEKGYLESIDGLLARKTFLQCEIPEVSQYEISQKYQNILDELSNIERELMVGASVVLALIHNRQLYIGNIGNCRALLCKNDSSNVLRVVQLSVDHTLYNEDELLRLVQIGLDIQTLKQAPFLTTRCIGCYTGKGGYKDSVFLSAATSEPIISQPEIVGAIPIDETCRFLILMSGGMCTTLHDVYATESQQVNKEIVQMTVEQFRQQSTLMGVAQSTVHKVVQLHHDAFMQNVEQSAAGDKNRTVRRTFNTRDDITFLVRNFNYILPNAIQRRNNNQVTFNPVIEQHTNESNYSESTLENLDSRGSGGGMTNTNQSIINTNTSSSSSDSRRAPFFDNTKKIKTYVDFTEFYANVEKARQNGTLPSSIVFD